MNNHYLDHVQVMLEQVENQVREELSGLNREQLNWRPAADAWSIAECLDHLIVTNRQYFRIFEDIKNNRLKTSVWGRIPGWTKLTGNMVLKGVDPENQKKYKTFKVFEPSASDHPRTIVEDFLTNQYELSTYIHELDGYDDHDKIVINSPVSKLIAFSLETGMNIIWKHTVRHLMQANRLRLMPGFPQSSNSQDKTG